MKIVVLLVVLCLTSVNQGWAVQKYFSQSTGDDSNQCTIDAPCKTLDKVHSVASAGGADIISLKAGDTWTGTKLIFASNVTYNSYGTGAKPIIQGSGSDYAASGNSTTGLVVDGLHFINNNYTALYFMEINDQLENLTIKNCKIESTGTPTPEEATVKAGIRIYTGPQVSNIVIGGAPGQGNEITSVGAGVVFQTVDHDNEAPSHDIDISYNNIHDSFGPGILTMGTWNVTPAPYGVNISHNTFKNITMSAIRVQAGIAYHVDQTNDISRPNSISYNVAENIGDIAIPNINAFQLNSLDTVTVEHNTIKNVKTLVGDGAGIAIDYGEMSYGSESKNVVVQYNRVSGCRVPVPTPELKPLLVQLGFPEDFPGKNAKGIDIMAGIDCIVRYNIVYDNDAGLVQEFYTSRNNSFYNNVSFGNNIGAKIYNDLEGTKESKWKNNIIVNNIEFGMWWGPLDVQPEESHNIFHNNFLDKVHAGVMVDIDPTDRSDDPRFVAPTQNDFRLQLSSPAISRGTNSVVSGIANLRDFTGTLVTNSSGAVLSRQINDLQATNVDIGPYFFNANDIRTLSINKEGTASGNVTSTPAGIDCGSVCSSQFALGTVVTLQAEPDPNSIFSGWLGGWCSGTEPCTFAIDTTQDVTARFDITFPVTATVVNGTGGSITPESAMIAHSAPVTFTITPASGYTLTGVTDNGALVTATPGGNGTFTYTIPEVTGNHDIRASFIISPPVAAFFAFPTTGVAPLTVSFTDGSSRPSTWSWNFGNGSTSTSQSPSHTFSQPGTYSVSLQVTNASGSNTTTKTNLVTVLAAPGSNVRIPRTPPVLYPSLGAAVNAVQGGEVIQSHAVEFQENLVFSRPLSIFLSGGYNGDFSTATEMTVLRGKFTITDGSITVKKMAIR